MTTKPLVLRPYFLSLAAAWSAIVVSLFLWAEGDQREAALGLLWFIGLAGLWCFARHLERRIREREWAQDALRESQDRFRTMVEALADWVWEVDPQGRYTYVGARVRDVLGYEPSALLGRTPADLVPAPAAEQAAAELAQLLRSRPPLWVSETVHRHERGHQVPIESRAVPFTDAGGSFLGFRGIDRDITSRKREQAELEEHRLHLEHLIAQRTVRLTEANRALEAEIAERMRMAAELERANAELRQKTAEMEQFVYTVSHDLKSPLVTIHGFAARAGEHLRAGHVEHVPDSLTRIQRAARRMTNLIDDLLELSRIGRVINEPGEVDLGAIIHEWAVDHEAELVARGVRLEVAPDLPCIRVDPVRIRQVFDNLLGNALRHGANGEMRPEGVTPVIACGWETDGAEVRFFVRDNGPGIATEHHEKIFELFHHLANGTSGTGVGLTIVRRIAEIHGGRVWVVSLPAEGAVFWFALPAAVLQSAAA